MAEYIERDALMKYPIRIDHCDMEHGKLDFVLGIESVLEYAEYLPAADVAPVVHGQWIDHMKCSVCGQVDWTKPNFCPNCGARMDGE